MLPDFDTLLHAYAEVIVRIGLNLQPGQRLLLTEPYELHGVAPAAAPLVAAVTAAARAAGCPDIQVQWSDPPRLRRYAEAADWRGFEALAEAQARRLRAHLRTGGALLFLLDSQPQFLAGVPAARANELRNIAWANFGPIARKLTAGATQWTAAPAPSPDWAGAVFPEIAPALRLPALWQAVFTAGRCTGPDPVAAWRRHLAALTDQQEELNRRRPSTLRYCGGGTDLTVRLPRGHRWRTAQLATPSGRPFVVNLPTDEVFTAPDRNSAEGRVCVARPVAYAGSIMEGVALDFRRGRVVAASARSGDDLLQQLLETDGGARRLGEVAVVPTGWAAAGLAAGPHPPGLRHYQHPLLDENLGPHVALGAAYGFCANSLLSTFTLNQSLIHVDLPLVAETTLG